MLRKQKRLTKKELKKDPLVLFAAQVVDFFHEYAIKLAIGITAVVLVAGLSSLFIITRHKNIEKAYETAITALYNNSPEALDLLKKVSDKYGSSSRGIEALIQLGNQYYALQDFDSAEKCFNKYIKKYSDDPVYSLNAYSTLASIYEEKGEFKKAGETYSKFANKNKSSAFVPFALLKATKDFYKAGEFSLAKTNAEKLLAKYPDSKEFAEAQSFSDILNKVQ